MSDILACPICGEAYRDEDFCPTHGTRLLPNRNSESGPETGAGITDKGQSAGQERDLASGEDRQSKLAKFMSRLRLRPLTGESVKRGVKPKTEATPAHDAGTPLPDEVVEQGWNVTGPVRTNAAGDTWPIEVQAPNGNIAGYFQRYRTGALTTETTYRRLVELTMPYMGLVWAHGTVNIGGARADFDVVSVPKGGIRLDEWFAETQPSEQRALQVYPALAQLVQALSALRLHPILVEPSHLLRKEDGDLSLVFAGAIADVPSEQSAPASKYRPEFARSALLARCWSAPELVLDTVLSVNTAVFSVGQILAQAAWGQPFGYRELQTGAVPFHSISDTRLASVLMGCLWPHSRGRWSVEDLARSLDCTRDEPLPPISPWASLVPGAASTSFSLAGESFWRLETLLRSATKPANWIEATSRFEAILEWAETTQWVGQAGLVRNALGKGRSADWALVRLARVVCPDMPLTWRELDLSDSEAAKSLAGLAQRALQTGDHAQSVRDLFQADLRGGFVPVQTSSPVNN